MLSFWQQDAFLQPTDIIIAGGGFMGLWSAYELKKQYPGMMITVLEKDIFPGGASVRNAGFACFGSPGELLADVATMGEDAMWRIVEMRYKGIKKIRQVLGDKTIDYDDCGGYECFTEKHLFEQVSDKISWLNEGMESITGNEDVFTIADDCLSALSMRNFKHMIANRLEGGLHSGKTIKALMQKLASIGVTILNGVNVIAWQKNIDNIQVKISGAIETTITTNKFLITINALSPQLNNNQKIVPARGQIIVTKPIEGLQMKGTFHYDEGYYYWRNIGNRILLGGARNQDFQAENTTNLSTSETIQLALEKFLYEHVDMPSNKIEIDHRWSGIMGFTDDKQPIIKMLEPDIWTAVACNGMGVALTPIIAEQVSAQMMG